MKFKLLFTLLFALILLLFQACRKKEEPIQKPIIGKVIGRLIDSCNGLPLSGTEVEFWQDGIGGSIYYPNLYPVPEMLLDKCMTDSDGYFHFEFPLPFRSHASVRLADSSGLVLAGEIFENSHFRYSEMDIGNLYCHGTFQLAVLKFANRDQIPFKMIWMEYVDPYLMKKCIDTFPGSSLNAWEVKRRVYYNLNPVKSGENFTYANRISLHITWPDNHDTLFYPVYTIHSKECSQSIDTFDFCIGCFH